MPYKDPAKRRLHDATPEHQAKRQAYREAHREQLLAESRAYEAANLEKRRAKSRDYQREHRQERRPYMQQYRREKAPEIAQTSKRYFANLPDEIKAQRRAHRRKRYAAHREKYRQQKRKDYWKHRMTRMAGLRRYYIAHPEIFTIGNTRRRARKAQASRNDFTAQEWKEMQQHYNYRCVYCPADCQQCKQRTHKLTQDHITPLSKGGSHTKSNIVPACARCNAKKFTGPPPKPVQPMLL